MLWVCPPLVVTQAELRQGLDIIEDSLKLVDQALVPKEHALTAI
jgi:hypothetical protein